MDELVASVIWILGFYPAEPPNTDQAGSLSGIRSVIPITNFRDACHCL